MQNKNKQKYVAPAIEIIEVENEGVIASSINGGISAPGMGNGGSAFGTSGTRSRSNNAHQSASPMQDLEDLINDILTVKK